CADSMCARRSSPCTVPGGEGPNRWRVSPSARAAARMPPFLERPPLCLARNCLTVRQFGPLESIDPNDAMILPHGADPDRMKFLKRTGSELSRRWCSSLLLLSRIRSLAGSIIDTLESSFQKGQAIGEEARARIRSRSCRLPGESGETFRAQREGLAPER